MKSLSVLVHRCVLCASALLFTSLASAQVNVNSTLPLPSTTPPPRGGLLGSNYLILEAARVDQKAANGSTTGANLGVNFAPADFADITTNLSWSRQRDWPDNGNIYQFGIDFTPHLTLGRVKPFVVGGMSYQFTRTPSGRDLGLWDLGGGAEILILPQTSLTVKAVNVGSFTKGISNPWQYSASVNHWLTKDLALNASVTFIEDQATGYTLGVRLGF